MTKTSQWPVPPDSIRYVIPDPVIRGLSRHPLTRDLYPLAFGLYAFAVQVNNNPALTMAAGLIMTLPVIVLFFFAQRYFIQGATLTGMKG